MARAVWFPQARAVELRREALPAAGPGDLRVRAIASAVSHGTEMLVYRGQVPSQMPLDLPAVRGDFDFPIKYGYASVGWVVQVGARVEGFATGDLVFVHHPHQTEYVVPATAQQGPEPVRLPPELPPEHGVFLANVETAVNVLLDAAPRLGERVVVFGQGVVGLLLTQLTRQAGAGLVIAVDPFSLRRELARAAGADVVLAPDENLPTTIRDLTGGLGADLVLEASGNPAALDQAIAATAFQGTVVVCSWYGTKPAAIDLGGAFHRRRIRIVSSQVGSIDPTLQARWSFRRRLDLARDLLSTLTLTPLITHRFPLARAAEAYDLIDRHPEETGQVILTYEGSDV